MELFVERGTMRILGGMGSNVYPTVDAGIYAMTNQIVAAVMKVSSGKATVTCLQMDRQGGYGEVKFWWKGKASNPPSAGSGSTNSATGRKYRRLVSFCGIFRNHVKTVGVIKKAHRKCKRK